MSFHVLFPKDKLSPKPENRNNSGDAASVQGTGQNQQEFVHLKSARIIHFFGTKLNNSFGSI